MRKCRYTGNTLDFETLSRMLNNLTSADGLLVRCPWCRCWMKWSYINSAHPGVMPYHTKGWSYEVTQ